MSLASRGFRHQVFVRLKSWLIDFLALELLLHLLEVEFGAVAGGGIVGHEIMGDACSTGFRIFPFFLDHTFRLYVLHVLGETL
jgi:hypothetical protein